MVVESFAQRTEVLKMDQFWMVDAGVGGDVAKDRRENHRLKGALLVVAFKARRTDENREAALVMLFDQAGHDVGFQQFIWMFCC